MEQDKQVNWFPSVNKFKANDKHMAVLHFPPKVSISKLKGSLEVIS